MAKKGKKKPSLEMTLFGVILSFPDLDNPKPFKGKVYFKTDCLLDSDHPQLKALKNSILKVRQQAWGEDKTEWPVKGKKVLLQDGSTRPDQKPYQGKFFITASTQNRVPVVDPKGREFNAATVKGGMTANVAIAISAWEFDGDEGISIYLQGVQVDTKKERLPGFGGGKSVKQMFNIKDDEDDENGVTDEDGGEEDDTPRGAKGKKASKNFDESEEE